MKRILLAASLLAAVSAPAAARPYFRLLDLSKPQTSVGAFIDPADVKETLAGSAVAVITHSPKDGCLLPRLACVDWTPFGMGYAAGGGHHRLTVGPSANLAPMVKAGLYGLLERFSNPDRYLGLKSTLAPVRSGRDFSVAFGPAWVVSPTAPPSFRVFTGAAWYFE